MFSVKRCFYMYNRKMNLWQKINEPRIRIGSRLWTYFEIGFVGLLAYILFFYEIKRVVMVMALMLSVVWHEWAHAKVANHYGDPTAKLQGRLTLNPLAHIDPLGSVLLPAVLIFSGVGFVFGWAKPVPVNTSYFKEPSKDMMFVALAGPVVNITLAFVAGFLFSVFKMLPIQWIVLDYFLYALRVMVPLNLVLAIFNLFPIPPLDGSRILNFFLPSRYQLFLHKIEPYGFFIVIGCAYFGLFDAVFRWIIPTVLPYFIQ